MMQQAPTQPQCEVIILTALPVECQAVLRYLDDPLEVVHRSGTIYHHGRFRGEHQTWRVAVVEIGLGGPSASLETERAIQFFSASIALFVGVAGGLKDVRLGDVVVATKIHAYEYGKDGATFEPRPEQWKASYPLAQRAQAEARSDAWLARLDDPPHTDAAPRVFVGPLAAGEKVVVSQQSDVARWLRAIYGDTLAVETEGHGFLQAVHANHSVHGLVIRGIGNLIDDKAEAEAAGWNDVAARHAAAFAFQVLSKFAGASNDRSVIGEIDDQSKAQKMATSSSVMASKDIDGSQLRQLRQAFLSAFPTRRDVEMMVSDAFNENLSALVSDGTLSHTIFELLRWAVAQGRLEELIKAALAHNSGNAQLKSIAAQLGVSSGQSSPSGIPRTATLPSIWNIPSPRNPFFTGQEKGLTQRSRTLKAGQAENVANKRQQKVEIFTEPPLLHSAQEEPKKEIPVPSLQSRPAKGLSRRMLLCVGLVGGSTLVGGSMIWFAASQRKGASPSARVTTQGTIPPKSSSPSTTPAHPDQMVQKWIFPTQGAVYSSPTVQDGVLYVGSDDHNVYAINASTGQKLWAVQTHSSWVQSTPTVVNGVLYIGSYDHNVYALNASTGQRLWVFPTGGVVYSSPTVYANVVYIGSYDEQVYALNASTGQKLWASPVSGPVYSSPTVQDGVVYIGCQDDKIYALNARTGQTRWAFRTGSDVESTPTVVDGMLYVGSNDGKIYAIDARTGQQQWTFPTEKKVASSPTVVNGILYIGSDDGKIYAIDARTGQPKWIFPTSGRVHSTPRVQNGALYIGSDDGKIYAIDVSTGKSKWPPFATGYGVWSSPVVVNDVLYIGSLGHNIYALTLPPS